MTYLSIENTSAYIEYIRTVLYSMATLENTYLVYFFNLQIMFLMFVEFFILHTEVQTAPDTHAHMHFHTNTSLRRTANEELHCMCFLAVDASGNTDLSQTV